MVFFTDSGLIEIISPPGEFYPDMASLKQTLGDDMERVTWRSKQALDFSFLMMYAKDRGTFYVQLEDDVLTKKVIIYSENISQSQMTIVPRISYQP